MLGESLREPSFDELLALEAELETIIEGYEFEEAEVAACGLAGVLDSSDKPTELNSKESTSTAPRNKKGSAEEERDATRFMMSGKCAGVDLDLFFPKRGESAREAKEVCGGCEVREECLEYALATGQKYGIWGGMSERQRRRMRRQRALAVRTQQA